MSKPRDSKKEVKKTPSKTLKERRTDKHLKKDAQQHPDYLVKPHGPAH